MDSWPADDIAGLVSKLALGPPPGLPGSPTLPVTVRPSCPAELLDRAGSPLALSSIPPSSSTNSLPLNGSTAGASSTASAASAAAAAAAAHNLGWGGQAIPDTAHFKAPWFGKNRSRGGAMAGGRGGRNGGGRGNGGRSNGGRSNGLRPRGRSGGEGSSGSDDMQDSTVSVEAIVGMASAVPRGEPLSSDVYGALFQLDSRSTALLLKDLSKSGLLARAVELFDWLRRLEQEHPLRSLLDVYSYTAAISLCISEHNAERALQLAGEMQTRGIERNVHTYTALMNVLIKCSKHGLALDTYRLMRQDGCTPNVVTFNTLIDVHGKMGNWEEAVGVLDAMKREGVAPVLRTYNTLIIACNMCNQPREAVGVYRRMLEEGHAPNSTTYNALISAYGKDGQLHKVMEVFQEMTCRGCERSVITYSSLISACEKAGQWELALEFFQEMCRERCSPNTVTYNSLITALAQGAQWEKAQEVFEQMHAPGHGGCRPDVVTYTALISALEKGGQWARALQAFERMRAQGCKADGIVYNAIIDALWETGVVWAQRRALALFRTAVEEGHFVQGKLAPGLPRCEVNLHAMTAGVAMLSLYAWLLSLRTLAASAGPAALPPLLAIVTDKGRGCREQGNLVVKEAVAAALAHWGAPFKAVADASYSGLLEGSGPRVAEWLLSPGFEARLYAYFPCTDIIPARLPGAQAGCATLDAATAAALDDRDGAKEAAVEGRCCEAFAAVRHFERTHCLALQNMGCAYLQRRAALVNCCLQLATRLGAPEEAAHDGVLLMDRVMSTALSLQPELLELLSTACVTTAIKQADGPAVTRQLPPEAQLEAATGLPPSAIEQMEWSIRQVLGGDTAAISALRCLKLYLERLGGGHMHPAAAGAIAGNTLLRARESLGDMAFLNCRPSVIAASILYVERRAQGCIPFWPTMLAKLTGYQDMSTPELAVSIKAAQRLAARSTRSPLAPVSAPGSSIGSSHSHSISTRSSSSASLSSLVAAAAATAGAGANGALPPGLAVPVQVPTSAALLSTTASPVSAAAVVSNGTAGRLSANSSLELPLSPAPVAAAAAAGAGSPAVAPMLTPPPGAAAHRGPASIEQQLFALQSALGPAMHVANGGGGGGVPTAALMDHAAAVAMLPHGHGHAAQHSALAGAGALPLHAVTAPLPVGHTAALVGEGLPLPLLSGLHGFPLAAGMLPAAAALHHQVPAQLLAPTQPMALMVGGPSGQLGAHHGAAAHFHTNHYFGN